MHKMNQTMQILRLKHQGEKFGAVATVLATGRAARDTAALSADELAQLTADVWTLPQPQMRPGEGPNLLRLLLRLGSAQYGRPFYGAVARKLAPRGTQ